MSHIQAPPDVLPPMPITPSQPHAVTQQVTPSQPVRTPAHTPSPCITPSPGAPPMVMPQRSTNKSNPEETPKHDSEKEEETLAEPLKTETDDENCVYFKISKSDINKPEIVKLLSDALSDNAKVTSSDTPDQMQTHTPMTLPPPPVINEVVVENKLPVQHVQPVAFVPPPAQPPVVQT